MYGQCMGNAWAMYAMCGQCVDNVWTMYGQCVGNVWTMCGQCVDNVWSSPDLVFCGDRRFTSLVRSLLALSRARGLVRQTGAAPDDRQLGHRGHFSDTSHATPGPNRCVSVWILRDRCTQTRALGPSQTPQESARDNRKNVVSSRAIRVGPSTSSRLRGAGLTSFRGLGTRCVPRVPYLGLSAHVRVCGRLEQGASATEALCAEVTFAIPDTPPRYEGYGVARGPVS